MLLFLVVVPIIGIFFTFISSSFGSDDLLTDRSVGFILSIIPFVWSLNVVYTLFDFSTNQFQFVQECIDLSFFHIYIGLDGISLFFIILTVIISPIAILSNWWSIWTTIPSFIIIILSLEMLLLLIFLVLDVLLFYVFFESILPPLFILIGLFGAYERVRASFYLFLYTLLGSLFLLLSILSMNSIMDTTDFDTLYKSNFDYLVQLFLFYGIFIAFAVKTPTIFLNTWLLRAHVESPLGGSILLAGVVLKLSLYGIIRLILGILPKASIEYTYIIYLIAIITIFYASLSTLRTIDVKELIAYSSVSHAAVYILGVFSNVIQGIEGSIILGLAHGFVSPGLFICAGGVLYDRSSSRLITFYKGMTQIMPLFAILFFILSLGNCGAPLTLNFIGEFLSLYGSFERLPLLGIFGSSSIVFSAAYTIYMYNRISFGGVLSRFFTVNISDLNKREFNLLLTLVILTVILGVYTVPLLDGLHYSVSSFIYLFDSNSINCDGPGIWSNFFNYKDIKNLDLSYYCSFFKENIDFLLYLVIFLVALLIDLYRCIRYLIRLYWRTYLFLIDKPNLIACLSLFPGFVSIVISFNFFGMFDYLNNFMFILGSYQEYLDLNQHSGLIQIHSGLNQHLNLIPQHLTPQHLMGAGIDNSDYDNEYTYTSNEESEKKSENNFYCSDNEQEPGGHQSHGHQSHGQQPGVQQSHEQQSNRDRYFQARLFIDRDWNGKPWSEEIKNNPQSIWQRTQSIWQTPQWTGHPIQSTGNPYQWTGHPIQSTGYPYQWTGHPIHTPANFDNHTDTMPLSEKAKLWEACEKKNGAHLFDIKRGVNETTPCDVSYGKHSLYRGNSSYDMVHHRCNACGLKVCSACFNQYRK